jgi:GLPGLI family protein
MKSLLLSITIIPFCTLLQGQVKGPDAVTSGKVTFEEKVKLDIKLEGDASQFADMLPKERKSEKILLFTKDAALFQDGINTDDAMQAEHSEGVVIRMISSGGQNKLYTDLKNNKVIDQKDFMNRIFLVEKDLPESNWKVTGNQKEILGYTCMEATKTDTAGIKTVVWFAPAIDIKTGPSGLGNLPGMILEADINNGSRTYTAKSVEPIAVKDLKIEKPKEGKKVSDSEFKIIVAEKMKEMGMEEGDSGSGTTHMRIVIKQ